MSLIDIPVALPGLSGGTLPSSPVATPLTNDLPSPHDGAWFRSVAGDDAQLGETLAPPLGARALGALKGYFDEKERALVGKLPRAFDLSDPKGVHDAVMAMHREHITGTLVVRSVSKCCQTVKEVASGQ